MSYRRLHVQRGVSSAPHLVTQLGLAERAKTESWVSCQWVLLGHYQQHLQAFDSCDVLQALDSRDVVQALDGYDVLEGDEGARLIAHVFRGTIADSFYWKSPRPKSWSFFSDWLSHRSPYVLKPTFPHLKRCDLIVSVLICLCYARLQTELRMADTDSTETDVPVYQIACKMQVRHVLNITETRFRLRSTLNDSTYEKAGDSLKKVLRVLVPDAAARWFLAQDQVVWEEFTTTFAAALPVIERQSCVPPDSTGSGHDISNAALMLANQTCLMMDLDKVNDLMALARSMLATLKAAQNKAAEAKCDQEVLKYIDLCVRVTSRCYDGDASPRVEAQWTSIINAFKKLLTTCLQFLHNLIAQNEQRKLLLWLDLFGSSKSSHPDLDFGGAGPLLADASVPPMAGPSTTKDFEEEFTATGVPIPSDEDLRIAMDRLAHGAGPSETPNRSEELATHAQVRTAFGQQSLLTLAELNISAQASLQPVDPSGTGKESKGKWDWAKIHLKDYSSEGIQESDKIIAKTPKAAAETLKEAKEQLMDRLVTRHTWADNTTDPGTGHIYTVPDADGSPGSGEGEEHVAGDESESMYPDLEDRDRGLLTDIPLVLGPSEMDALVLIVRAGITPCLEFPADPKEAMEAKQMQAVRCNILLAQDAGRNLLRELLIFIAAWEFDESVFYFKLMLQIMDAILNHGLMPFAYQTFGEVKDIVSPAQSIVIKLLTQLFRKKQNTSPPAGYKVLHGSPPVVPTRADLLVVRYIFTVFRQSIIPETCALIYLQGRIRQGAAYPEDFPLTLWDMERVYEGVYQFLEFFAVLTENEMWKDMLVKWEIVSELVTLLRELDASIPKAPLPSVQTAREGADAAGNARPAQASTSAPGQVERPYDPVSTDESAPAGDNANATAPESPSRDPENPDPADFEWRNLKKLVVLVLSSLVWKSTPVQNQIRQFGGVEMVLNCCNYDANNLYIREHAIMCLRFLLENSPENQEIVEKLEARKVVPSEVLDSKGYETFIDADGKVGLRPKDPSSLG